MCKPIVRERPAVYHTRNRVARGDAYTSRSLGLVTDGRRWLAMWVVNGEVMLQCWPGGSVVTDIAAPGGVRRLLDRLYHLLHENVDPFRS